MKGLIGKKIGMTQIFDANGRFVPVTVIQAGPCYVTQVKKLEIDGYSAVQLGFDSVREKVKTKAEMGHLKKANVPAVRVLHEFAITPEEEQQLALGQSLSVDLFNAGALVKVVGISKGRGFTGVMKRHGFHGGRASHGSKFHRKPFSIGMHTDPARVFKNKKMPGHYGTEQITVRRLRVVNIDMDKHIILVQGAIPGPKNGYVYVKQDN